MAKIVIIGAGLTGLSAAYHLEKQGFYEYKLFEKENIVGGLCRSVYQDGFTFDFTGHLLHISDPYFQELIKQVVGVENLFNIVRKSFIYSHNTYTPYPYQINLHGLPTEVIADCIQGFVSRKKSRKKPKKYYQWVLQNFGAGFGKHFFFPYQRKLFDYDPRKLSASWTSRFVPKTSLKQIINGATKPNDVSQVGYNATFFYPKTGGIFYWIHKLAKQLKNKIYTNFCIKSIDLKNKVILFENGDFETFDTLISTMPLDVLLKLIKETPRLSLKQTGKKLLCNSVVNFNLGVFKENISDKHWIYFPQKRAPFYRLGFYHNFSTAMAPKGCGCVYGEFSHLKKSKKIVSEKLIDSLRSTKKLLGISDADLLTEKIIHIPHAYVVYDSWREKNLTSIHKRLHENKIYSIGRYGQWKYSSMQEAILDGKNIVDTLIGEFPSLDNTTKAKKYSQKRK